MLMPIPPPRRVRSACPLEDKEKANGLLPREVNQGPFFSPREQTARLGDLCVSA